MVIIELLKALSPYLLELGLGASALLAVRTHRQVLAALVDRVNHHERRLVRVEEKLGLTPLELRNLELTRLQSIT